MANPNSLQTGLPPPPSSSQAPPGPDDTRVYRNTPHSLIPTFELPSDKIQVVHMDADDGEKLSATTFEGTGFVRWPVRTEYLNDIRGWSHAVDVSWYSHIYIIAEAAFRLRHDSWNLKFDRASSQEKKKIALRVERLRSLIMICKKANSLTSEAANDLVAMGTPHFRDVLTTVLESCRAIDNVNELVEIGFRDEKLECRGVFLFDIWKNHHLVLRPEHEQSGVFSEDFQAARYSSKAVNSGYWMKRIKTEPAVVNEQ